MVSAGLADAIDPSSVVAASLGHPLVTQYLLGKLASADTEERQKLNRLAWREAEEADSEVSKVPYTLGLGRDDVAVHGFRSTFKDWAAEGTHFPNELSEMALAHPIGDRTEAAYRRGDLFEKRRAMMDAWAGFLASAGNGPTVVIKTAQRDLSACHKTKISGPLSAWRRLTSQRSADFIGAAVACWHRQVRLHRGNDRRSAT